MLGNLQRRLKRKLEQYRLQLYRDKSEYIYEKLGSKYGGWHVPIDFLDVASVCYCVGAGEDISFDIELINRIGCSVYTFDPTPRASQHVKLLKENTSLNHKTFINRDIGEFYQCNANTLSQLHFYQFGLWDKQKVMRFYAPQNPSHVSHSLVNLQRTQEYFEAECRTLKDIMSELNHTGLSLLKLDVEGAEYRIIDSMLADDISPSILCLEFDEGHTPQDHKYFNRIIEVILKLKKAGYLAAVFDGWNVTFVLQKALGAKSL